VLYNLCGLRKNGSELPTISLSPLETEEGVLVSSSIREITEHKPVEEILDSNDVADLRNRVAQALGRRLLRSTLGRLLRGAGGPVGGWARVSRFDLALWDKVP
jgi:hypothetical protein